MKAFEKWWKKAFPADMRYESAYHKSLFEDGWKAALNWVRSLMGCDEREQSEEFIWTDVDEKIKEELEK